MGEPAQQSQQVTNAKPIDYDELFPGRFLKWGLFKGKDVTLTITRAHVEMLPGEKGEKERAVVSFKETPKQLTLCKTNGLCLKAMLGRDVSKWTGRRVTFYPDETIKVGAKVVGGIRVRGAPDLAEPLTVEIALPQKRPFTMTLKPTKAVGSAKVADEPQRDEATGEIVPPPGDA